ncbi:MAG TPA: VOC family protein [Candidatus Binatia bacterium]
MPKIRHLAIRTEDTGKLASFYMDVFEMQILHKDKNEGGAIYLTDGYFNLGVCAAENFPASQKISCT